ncbi:MAG: PAS domain S-box protein [Opitutae bacterium]|nr:PAS domain S-box protein [Opitutae bacterium]
MSTTAPHISDGPLREAEDLFHDLIEALPDAVSLVDREGRIAYASRTGLKLYGVPSVALAIGQVALDFVAPEERERAAQHLTEVWAGRPARSAQYTLLRADGSRFIGEINLARCNEAAGRPSLVIAVTRDVTERTQREAALMESERHFRTVLLNAQAIIFIIDREGVFRLSEGQALAALGFRPGQVVGQSAFELYRDFPSVVESIRRALAGELVRVINDLNGAIFDTVYTPYRDLDGRVTGVVGISIDITERRRAEIALQQKSEEIDRYFTSALDLLCIADTGGFFRRLNPQWEATLGYTAADLQGRSFLDLIHPDDLESTLKAVSQLAAQKDVFNFINRYRHKDGSYRWIEWRSFASGELIYATARDITDRRRTEEALRESEQRFHALFDHMTEGVALHEMVYDASGQAVDYRILEVNPAYEKHTGISARQVRGQLASVGYGTSQPPYLAEWAAVVASGQPHHQETYFPPLKRHFRISAISPKPGFFATVFEDITERKLREEELRRKNEELERFTYTVSHDLKSPLITIKGFAGSLLHDVAAGRHERLAPDLQRIADATDRMAGLLSDLLELSRIGRSAHPPGEVHFAQLARDTLELLAGPIHKRQVTVTVQPDFPVVYGDRRRLQTVVQNLVENAVKFMGDQPQPRIEIGWRAAGSETVFFVRDNGMGIDPRYHQTVFGLFNKLEAKTEGTGIGLAIVQRIIEVHGGRIWLESEGAGRGSTVCFTLPLPAKKEPTP